MTTTLEAITDPPHGWLVVIVGNGDLDEDIGPDDLRWFKTADQVRDFAASVVRCDVAAYAIGDRHRVLVIPQPPPVTIEKTP